MEISTREVRKSIKAWLTEERATAVQALELQSALEAGLIKGNTYAGYRVADLATVDQVYSWQVERAQNNYDVPEAYEDTPDCGCLVETLEQIKGKRPDKDLGPNADETYALALLIKLGDTPENSKWVRAAVRGIEDYLTTLETANATA